MPIQIVHSVKLIVLALCLFWVSPVSLGVPSLINLGTLGGNASAGRGVSGDGTIIVGWSRQPDGGDRAVRWSKANGVQSLGTLGGFHSQAFGVSADGTTVVGSSQVGLPFDRAIHWTQTTGLQNLGLLPGFNHAEASGVSSDGTVAVGWMRTLDDGSDARAFSWTAETGVTNLGPIPGGSTSSAHGISLDGSTAVGSGRTPLGLRAFKWTASGMQLLGTLPGASSSHASGVSGDGQIVVGWSGVRAFRWSSKSGMQSIGTLVIGGESFAHAISGNGEIIIGSAAYSPGGPRRAFIWTLTSGIKDLNDHLTSLGVDMTGWELTHANGLSFNGSTLTGEGRFNGEMRAWVALNVVPPIGCPADTNHDFGIDGADLSFFLGVFGAIVDTFPSADPADFNDDGIVNAADLSILLSNFGSSCGP